MDDLVTWLRAVWDEDELVARAADCGRWLPEDKGITFEFYGDEFPDGDAQARLVADTRANQWHIANWDPARVLAEVEAKRRIIDLYVASQGAEFPDFSGGYAAALDDVLCLLALPYRDRPGYRPEWAPVDAETAGQDTP